MNRDRTWIGAVLLLAFGCVSAPAPPVQPVPGVGHVGPPVAAGDGGTARFVPALYDAYDVPRSMETLRFVDRYYRTPANEGYDASFEHVRSRLEDLGFGSEEGLTLCVMTSEMDLPAWTPVSASLTLERPDGTAIVLHAFSDESDVDRVMLSQNAPGGHVRGQAVFSLEEVEPGTILVTETAVRPDLLERARDRGAGAVVSASLAGYNVDPHGVDRQLEAIQLRRHEVTPDLPVVQISPRSFARIQEEHVRVGGAQLLLEAEVRLEERPLRTLCAEVVGRELPDEAVVLTSHLDQPGASDNASGVAGLLEGLGTYVELVGAGRLVRPERSLVFLFGPELSQSEEWLADTERTCVASYTLIQAGDSPSKTGAVALLERAPDPGALRTLPPDEHTAWGEGLVTPDLLIPTGIGVIGRCALADVTAHVGGEWRSADHPYEGGTDHQTFLEAGFPAALFWHFAGLTYHTSLDRLEHVDPEEIRRTAVAVLASALAIADPRPADLSRYLTSVDLEEDVRVTAALQAGDAELAADWREWSARVRSWLRGLCSR